jgi:hypothetical protein
MRQSVLGVLLFALLAGAAAPAVQADEVGGYMAEAARRFLGALDDKQRAEASFAFDSPERVNWHWIPRERKGVPIKALSPDQRALAFGLLDTGLSTDGMIKATTIMSYEEILRVAEQGKGPVRDSELYFVSVFGKPGDPAGWGWRMEGHHLALNFTLKDNRVVSATPFMFGTNPAEVKSGPNKGLKNLGDIEHPAHELLRSLSKEQQQAAVLPGEIPDVNNGPNPAKAELGAPEGISSDKLNPEQRELLTAFIRGYSSLFPEVVRDELLKQLASGNQTYYFAWYGPVDPAAPHAFKVQGPTVFIDYNKKQDNANHIHTFYRSLPGDFGQAGGR